MFHETQESDSQPDHRYNIYDQTEYEKKPDLPSLLSSLRNNFFQGFPQKPKKPP